MSPPGESTTAMCELIKEMCDLNFCLYIQEEEEKRKKNAYFVCRDEFYAAYAVQMCG